MTNSNPTDSLIKFQNVDLGYGRKRILNDVSFAVSRGDYLAIVGANGGGKTTLLRALLGLLKPQNGTISRDKNLHFGYVPQLQSVDEIFPLTAFDVVLMGRFGRLGALRQPSPDDRVRAHRVLDEVGIAPLAAHLYRDLSGGQKQRTLIARALVGEPDVLVLDEHTNDLDIAGERAIMSLLKRIHNEHRFAIVMVSHSLNAVANHCRTVGILRENRCTFTPIANVLNDDYLSEVYGVPLRVLEHNGQRVIV